MAVGAAGTAGVNVGLVGVRRPVAEQPAERARRTSRPSRCSQAGGKGSRTSPKWCRAITASLERVRHPPAVHLAGGGEPEHRLEAAARSRTQGRTSQTKCAVSFADVPEAVRRAGRDDDAVAWAGHDRLAPEET